MADLALTDATHGDRQLTVEYRRLDDLVPYGNIVTGDWTTQFERDACILPSKGGETVIAARLQSVQPALIIVRYDAETSTITPDWRLIELRSGAIYNIRTSADMERRGRWWTMLCEAGVAT